MLFSKEIRGALEAILFVRAEPIKAEEVSVILGISAAEAGMLSRSLRNIIMTVKAVCR
jgi:chromosome segregation and condensation protein ScpB